MVRCCVFAALVSACGGSQSHALPGSGAQPYTINGVPDNDSFHPSWATDGKRFVYVRDYQLFVYDVANSRSRQITRGGALKRDPTWSPNGSRIAFTASSLDTASSMGGTYLCGLVYTVRPDGSGRHRVSPPGASDCDATWSPDGRHLAVDGVRTGSLRHGCTGLTKPGQLPCPPPGYAEGLYVMSASGTEQRPVAYRANGFDSFEWSPDGTRLAFDDFDTGHTYVFDLRSGRLVDVARRVMRDHPELSQDLFSDPHWSPDGSRLAVNIGDPAGPAVWYLVRANGSGGSRVRGPHWLPCNPAMGNIGPVPAAHPCEAVRSPDGTRTVDNTFGALLLLTMTHPRRQIVIARRAELPRRRPVRRTG
jgi:dipeptidyl aminopeptidase/acylaminoacyl peptidase